MDQCKHCLVRGDMGKCLITPCSYHELWMVCQLKTDLRKLVEEMKTDLEDKEFSSAYRFATIKWLGRLKNLAGGE